MLTSPGATNTYIDQYRAIAGSDMERPNLLPERIEYIDHQCPEVLHDVWSRVNDDTSPRCPLRPAEFREIKELA
jgi:hypothetical protein